MSSAVFARLIARDNILILLEMLPILRRISPFRYSSFEVSVKFSRRGWKFLEIILEFNDRKETIGGFLLKINLTRV